MCVSSEQKAARRAITDTVMRSEGGILLLNDRASEAAEVLTRAADLLDADSRAGQRVALFARLAKKLG